MWTKCRLCAEYSICGPFEMHEDPLWNTRYSAAFLIRSSALTRPTIHCVRQNASAALIQDTWCTHRIGGNFLESIGFANTAVLSSLRNLVHTLATLLVGHTLTSTVLSKISSAHIYLLTSTPFFYLVHTLPYTFLLDLSCTVIYTLTSALFF